MSYLFSIPVLDSSNELLLLSGRSEMLANDERAGILGTQGHSKVVLVIRS